MAADEQFVEMNFPAAGIDKSKAFSKQTPRPTLEGVYSRTAPAATNVRGYDARQGRLRGGSRPGLAKAIPQPPVYGWIVQCLDVLVGSGYDQPAAGPSDIEPEWDGVFPAWDGTEPAWGET